MSQSVSRIRAAIDAMDGSFLLLEPAMDVAIVGLVSGAGRQPVVCYDRDKVVQVLVERDGMERDEAEEFFDVNIEGAYVGPETPMFISSTQTLLAGH
jgi:hypothetical protein